MGQKHFIWDDDDLFPADFSEKLLTRRCANGRLYRSTAISASRFAVSRTCQYRVDAACVSRTSSFRFPHLLE